VHQVGKVGSQSVFRALQEQVDVPVYQTHVLNTTLRYFNEEEPAPPAGCDALPPHVIRAQELMSRFLQPGRPLAIITPVRDPVARNISGFFQNLNRFPHLIADGGYAPMADFLDTFFTQWKHREADDWFKYNYLQPFGVDVFTHPFNRERGYDSFADGNRVFLLMQMELDDATKAEAVRSLLGLRSFSLAERVNVSGDKPYAEVYKAFLDAIRLERGYLDEVYATRVAEHFYTPEQLAGFRATWEQAAVKRGAGSQGTTHAGKGVSTSGPAAKRDRGRSGWIRRLFRA